MRKPFTIGLIALCSLTTLALTSPISVAAEESKASAPLLSLYKSMLALGTQVAATKEANRDRLVLRQCINDLTIHTDLLDETINKAINGADISSVQTKLNTTRAQKIIANFQVAAQQSTALPNEPALKAVFMRHMTQLEGILDKKDMDTLMSALPKINLNEAMDNQSLVLSKMMEVPECRLAIVKMSEKKQMP